MFNKIFKRKDDKPNKINDISEVFEVFGNYQKVQYLLACLPALLVNLLNINYIFVAGDVNYRCRVPECDAPYTHDQHPSWWPNGTIDRCYRPVLTENYLHGACTNESFTGAVEKCTEWIYENNSTAIVELDLACQSLKSNLIGTIHSFGTMCSMLVGGWLCDRFGRKPVMIVCVMAAVVGQLKVFAKSYYVYIAIEFLESALTDGANGAAMVIMIEISSSKTRLLAGVLFAYAVYVGEFLFAIISMYVQEWKNLVRIIYSPPLFFIIYIFIAKESPRWQILQGKIEQAKQSLKYIAEKNNIDISNHGLDEMDAMQLKEKFNMGGYTKKESFKKVFGSREILLRLLVAAVCRFTASFVYYGLMINSVWLPGNKYTNFMLATLMSFPGELLALYLMNKIGRKVPLICGFILSGAVCVGTAYIPKENPWALITMFLIGKGLISACYTGALTYVMELFPTSARGSLLGLGAFAARLGGMMAPLTPVLRDISPIIPPLLFGGSALISGFLLTLTPETKGQPLQDTIDQVNAAAKLDKEKKLNKKIENDYVKHASNTVTSTM